MAEGSHGIECNLVMSVVVSSSDCKRRYSEGVCGGGGGGGGGVATITGGLCPVCDCLGSDCNCFST